MGDLADVDAAGLLQLFAGRRATGRLRLAVAGDEVGFYLRGGALAAATSARLPLRLGEVLRRRGVLDVARLRAALRDQAGTHPPRPLGEIVVTRGWATAAEVARCVEEQSVAALARVLAARHGTFAWEPGVPAPVAAIPVALDATRLLLEAARRGDELAALWRRLPAPDAPLALGPGVAAGTAPLRGTEAKVAAAVAAGARSVGELVDLLPGEEGAVLAAVRRMLERGAILAGGGAAAPPAAAPPPSAEAELGRLFVVPGAAELDAAVAAAHLAG